MNVYHAVVWSFKTAYHHTGETDMEDKFPLRKPKFVCRKCGGDMKPGQALQNTVEYAEDRLTHSDSHVGQTASYTGKPVMVSVQKCVDCGHSFRSHWHGRWLLGTKGKGRWKGHWGKGRKMRWPKDNWQLGLCNQRMGQDQGRGEAMSRCMRCQACGQEFYGYTPLDCPCMKPPHTRKPLENGNLFIAICWVLCIGIITGAGLGSWIHSWKDNDKPAMLSPHNKTSTKTCSCMDNKQNASESK